MGKECRPLNLSEICLQIILFSLDLLTVLSDSTAKGFSMYVAIGVASLDISKALYRVSHYSLHKTLVFRNFQLDFGLILSFYRDGFLWFWMGYFCKCVSLMLVFDSFFLIQLFSWYTLMIFLMIWFVILPCGWNYSQI